MSQNQLIAILTIVLLLVIGGSIVILLTTSDSSTPPADSVASPQATSGQFTLNLKPLEQSAYQLINKQLVKEGALPVQPPATPGKANPFL